MEGIGRGTTLGGRYAVEAPLQNVQGAGRWAAFDDDLARHVTVLALPRADHRAASLLDAARMAAGIAQTSLVRILDIGYDDHVVFVVEESLAGATPLTALVRGGGLPGDEARRITGEVATGLETASQRGLHHLELTPDDVFRTVDGEIKVRGLGTSAALHFRADSGELAARVDAIAIVALAYAALTGLAPEPALAGGLPPAPRVGGSVPVPSELAAGVPRDLDRLCELTLIEQAGPVNPGDYARQVAPWPTRQVNHDHVGGTTRPAATSAVPVRVAVAGEAAPAAQAPPPGAAPPGPALGHTGDAQETAEPSPRRPAGLRAVGLEAPAPLVPAEPLSRNESTWALAIVAAFVVLSLIVGLYGISRIGSQTDLHLGDSAAAKPSQSAASSATAGSDGAAAPQTLAILSADGFDPEGDQSEGANLAPRVFDGDPTTAWMTEGYTTAPLGGLKSGVGLLIDLGPNRTARTIQIDFLAECNFSLAVSPDRALQPATLVGQQDGANGHVSISVPEGVSGQYIIVWLTSLTRDSDGYYRGKVGEVTVYG